MSVTYLHGAETEELTTPNAVIQVVKSSVIFLVGVAPTGPVNVPTLVSGASTAAQFGSELPGFNIPEALAAIQAQGSCLAIVVNTFDAATNTAAVAAESVVVDAGRAQLAFAPVVTAPVVKQGSTVLVLGTDYTINPYGLIKIVNRSSSGGYPDGTTLTVAYTKFDASTVLSAQLVGTVNSTTNARTGLQLAASCFNLFGFNPKIVLVPGYSQLTTVADAMLEVADKYRALALLDAPKNTYVPAVLAAREGTAQIGRFSTTKERAVLCYPWEKRTDPASESGATKLVPRSVLLAGVISYVDSEFGYWFSPSSYEIKESAGPEIPITASWTDPTAECQQLNAVGVVTVFSGFGGVNKTFGNRSAAFPTSTATTQFISVRRVADIVADSMELSSIAYADKPLTEPLIDTIRQDATAFLATLKARGAILNGRCWFDKDANPDSELAKGILLLDYDLMPPTPAERFKYRARINTKYLAQLLAGE